MTLQSEKFLESLGKGRLVSQLSLVEVKQILTGFAAIMGIPASNMPPEEVMMMTIQAIVTNFGAMHEGEIRKAFEMAAIGQLEIEEHYQSLSLKYICNVLNAYRIKVNLAMRYYERVRKEPVSEPHNGEVDWSDTVANLIQQAKVKDLRTIVIPVFVYDWLIRQGIIALSNEQKKAYIKKAEHEIGEELMAKIMRRKSSDEEKKWYELLQTSSYKKGDVLHSKVVNKAKTIIVRDYIKQQP